MGSGRPQQLQQSHRLVARDPCYRGECQVQWQDLGSGGNAHAEDQGQDLLHGDGGLLPDLALFCTLLSLLPSSCLPAFLCHHTIQQLISLLISGQVQEALECASRARAHRHGWWQSCLKTAERLRCTCSVSQHSVDHTALDWHGKAKRGQNSVVLVTVLSIQQHSLR